MGKKWVFKNLLLIFFLIAAVILQSSYVNVVRAQGESENTELLRGKEVYFIDSTLKDYKSIISSLKTKENIFVLNSRLDGIKQITDILKRYESVSHIYIFSHGDTGSFRFGNIDLMPENINGYQDELAQWTKYLSKNPEVMLYGCNTARGSRGKKFVQYFSDIVQADVIASEKLIGAASKGGNWKLGYSTGNNRKLDIFKSGIYNYGYLLNGTTRYWDGGGNDSNWNTKENWSGDVVPTEYDNVVFGVDGVQPSNSSLVSAIVYSPSVDTVFGSVYPLNAGNALGAMSPNAKDVNVTSDVSVYNFTINPQYTGKLNFNSGTITVNGDALIQGGSCQFNCMKCKGNYSQVNGNVGFLNSSDFYKDFSCTGGSTAGSDFNFYNSGIQNFNAGSSGLKIRSLIVIGGSLPGEFDISGNVILNDSYSNFRISNSVTVNLNGNITYTMTGGLSRFNNSGILNINDGSVLDVEKANEYINYNKIVENGTGKILRKCKGISFTDGSGNAVSTIAFGNNIYITLYDDDENLDGTKRDTVSVILKSCESGDTETVTLTETYSSGIFRNTVGIPVVSPGTGASGDSKLIYNGTEDVTASYTDPKDAADTVTRSLNPPPIVWNGAGANNNWDNAQNWEGNKVPSAFDNVLFDGTKSNKDVQINSGVNIQNLTIASSYTGNFTIGFNMDLKIDGDANINGGTVTSSGNTTIKGKLNVDGLGTWNGSYSRQDRYCDIIVKGGQLKLSNSSAYRTQISGNVDCSGGTADLSGADIVFMKSGIEDFKTGSKNIVVHSIDVLNSYTTVNVLGNLTVSGGNFSNSGVLLIPDGSVLDVQKAAAYLLSHNGKMNVTGSGRVIRKAKGIGFTDADGNPVSTINPGDKIFITLLDDDANLNAALPDEVKVKLVSPTTDDEEILHLRETTNTSMVFRNQIGFLTSNGAVSKGDNVLQFSSGEDLMVSYVDSCDDSDVINSNLKKTPIVWDGGGSDNKWSTAQNWSTDTVPTSFDSVVFNGTSIKDVQLDATAEVMKLNVEPAYMGTITVMGSGLLNVNGNTLINGGNIDFIGVCNFKGDFTVENGAVILNTGGYYDFYLKTFYGNVYFKGGSQTLKGNKFHFYKDFKRTGGSIVLNNAGFNFDGNVVQNFDTGDSCMPLTNINTYNNNSSQVLNINGNVTISKALYNGLCINKNTAVNIFGKVVFSEGNSTYASDFTNYGTVTIKDNGVLDTSAANFYNYNKILLEGTGKSSHLNKGMGVINASGQPALDAFRFGQPLIVSLTDGDANLDGTKPDEVSVTLKNWSNNDTETLILTETGNSTGIFKSAPYTTASSTTGAPGNNIFEGDGNDAIRDHVQIIYQDAHDHDDKYVISLNCAQIKVSASSIDLGTIIDGGSKQCVVTITNSGDIPLNLSQIALDDTTNFKFHSEPVISPLAPNTSRTITVDFVPQGSGEKTSNLTIKSDDFDEGTLVIPIHGRVVGRPTANITYSKNSVTTGASITITAEFSEELADSPVPQIEISGANTLAATDMTKVTASKYMYSYTVGEGEGKAYVVLSKGISKDGLPIMPTPAVGEYFTVDNLSPSAPVITGVEEGKIYAAVTPVWTDEVGTTSSATLDGEAYTGGTEVNTSGAHTLIVTARKTSNGLTAQTTIHFTIDKAAPSAPVITGVEEGKTYAAVTPVWTDEPGTSSTATLDGKAYTSGTEINENGSHVLKVVVKKDTNGFSTETVVNFVIDNAAPAQANITGVEEGKTYTFAVPAWIDKQGTTSSATLDGKPYTRGTEIDTEGQHTLAVTTRKSSNGLTATTTINFIIRKSNPAPSPDNGGSTTPVTPSAPISDNSSSSPAASAALGENTGADIVINGQVEKAATVTTVTEGDQKITVFQLDDKKIEEKLANSGNSTVITISAPSYSPSTAINGILSAQTVKDIGNKGGIIEVKTDTASYTLPADKINVDGISKQFGSDVDLKDIKVSVSLTKSGEDEVRIVEDTANKNGYSIIVKPTDFEIKCTYGDKSIIIDKFNGYVERLLAIPDGIDPSRITTGIVMNSDGTFYHVPTFITVVNGKYYAKISSMTNSTYSIIWNPLAFKDVEKHWAKSAINNMGSRLIVTGMGNDSFEPDRDITRAEFASIIVKGLGLMRNGKGKDSFADVGKKDWYYDAVSIANEYGLIKGTGKDSFDPARKITREEAMAIISRAIAIVKLKTELTEVQKKETLDKFNDISDISDWAKDYVALCTYDNIIVGKANGIKPKQNITRAEVATIVERLLKKSGLIN